MYKCTGCDMLFYSQVDCEAHRNNHHEGDNPGGCVAVKYACPRCGQQFGHPWDVRNHAMREHGWQRAAPVEVLLD